MNRAKVAELMAEMYSEEQYTREQGQKEYSHDEGDAFMNFKRVAQDLGLDQKAVLWTYLRKHLDGIVAYIKGHKSQREDVRGRIKDARVYLVLLRGMIEDEEAAQIIEIDEKGVVSVRS